MPQDSEYDEEDCEPLPPQVRSRHLTDKPHDRREHSIDILLAIICGAVLATLFLLRVLRP